jgi:hypothetical protein
MSCTVSWTGGGLFLRDGRLEISWIFLLFPKKLNPLFASALEFEELAFALCILPDECEVAEDDRLAVSSSFALLAFLAPTVSAC